MYYFDILGFRSKKGEFRCVRPSEGSLSVALYQKTLILDMLTHATHTQCKRSKIKS